MGLLDKIKLGIDTPRWQQMSPAPNIHAAGGSLCTDKRTDGYPMICQLASATVFNVYFGPQNGWVFVGTPGISAFGAGSACVFVPSMTYVGSIGVGSTTTSVVTTTVLASIPLNGFAVSETMGFKIRIIHNSAGGTGLVEERYIIGNTSGTTPTVYLNQALLSAPASGDTYEIIAGKVFFLGTTAGVTQFRYYMFGAGTFNSATQTALLIATESNMIALDEQYTPYDRISGEGFKVGVGTYDVGYITKYCLTATGIGAGSITGEAAAGDFDVLQNEYRNFQIRIVEDTGIPTAVGQRSIIASHTAGPSPVYTLGTNWATTPSANAKFVIELPNQVILFTVAAGTAVYTFNPTAYTINNGTNSILTNAWSTTYFGARGTVIAAGAFTFPSYGHEPTLNADGTRLSRHSYIYSFRGGTTALDLLDIAGGVTGAWTNAVPYVAEGTSFTTGSGGDYAPLDQKGDWGYYVIGATGVCGRFSVKWRALQGWTTLPAQSGTAAVGNRVVVLPYVNSTGADRMSLLYMQSHLLGVLYRSEIII